MDSPRRDNSNVSWLVSRRHASRNARIKAPPLVYSWERTLTLLFGDASAFILAAFLASFVVAHAWNSNLDYRRILISTIISGVVCLLVCERLGLYRKSLAQHFRDEFYYVVAALCLTIVPQVIVFSLVPAISTSRAVLVLTLLFAVPLVGAFRAISHALSDGPRLRRPTRIAVIGDPLSAQYVQAALKSVERVETLQLNGDEPLLPSLERVRLWDADKLVFAEIPAPESLPQILAFVEQAEIGVAFAAPRIPAQGYAFSLERFGDQPLMVPRPMQACTERARVLKRAVDVGCAAVALGLFLPLMALIAAMLWLEGKGSVLYRQERIGQCGRRFTMLKFRSMEPCAEDATGPVWAKPHDARVTRLGALLRRTSLDELPQLFNVLRGDMSVVGPRPERPFFVEMFQQMLPRYEERHVVKPGITGWSQVHMQRVLEPWAVGEKLGFDLFYIENWSLFMDVSVLFKTAVEFLFHKAA